MELGKVGKPVHVAGLRAVTSRRQAIWASRPGLKTGRASKLDRMLLADFPIGESSSHRSLNP